MIGSHGRRKWGVLRLLVTDTLYIWFEFTQPHVYRKTKSCLDELADSWNACLNTDAVCDSEWFILVCALVQVIVSCQVSWLQTLGQWSFSGRTSKTHLRVNKYSGTALYDVTAGWNSDWTVNWMFSDWSSGCSVPSKSDCLQFHRAHSDWVSVFTCTE